MPDPFDDPEIIEWADRVLTELIPKLRQSGMTLSLVPDEPNKTDVKFAVELGLSIMFDKPLLIVVRPGMQVPEHLVRVADEIVEMDDRWLDSPTNRRRLKEAVDRMMERLDA